MCQFEVEKDAGSESTLALVRAEAEPTKDEVLREGRAIAFMRQTAEGFEQTKKQEESPPGNLMEAIELQAQMGPGQGKTDANRNCRAPSGDRNRSWR